jgi:hypothetical protein
MRLWHLRGLWLGVLVGALAFGASWQLRAIYIEPSSAALTCNATPHPGWCVIRFAILAAQHNALFGVAALVAGVAALLRGGPAAAVAAAGLSVVAIVNFNVEMGALALVFGLIGAVRERATRRRGDELRRV